MVVYSATIVELSTESIAFFPIIRFLRLSSLRTSENTSLIDGRVVFPST